MVSREVAEELLEGLEYGVTGGLQSSRLGGPTFPGPGGRRCPAPGPSTDFSGKSRKMLGARLRPKWQSHDLLVDFDELGVLH